MCFLENVICFGGQLEPKWKLEVKAVFVCMCHGAVNWTQGLTNIMHIFYWDRPQSYLSVYFTVISWWPEAIPVATGD